MKKFAALFIIFFIFSLLNCSTSLYGEDDKPPSSNENEYKELAEKQFIRFLFEKIFRIQGEIDRFILECKLSTNEIAFFEKIFADKQLSNLLLSIPNNLPTIRLDIISSADAPKIEFFEFKSSLFTTCIKVTRISAPNTVSMMIVRYSKARCEHSLLPCSDYSEQSILYVDVAGVLVQEP